MFGDIFLATRALRRNPGFVAAATIILGIGIGANTAVFSLFEALMLRTLPVARPGELAVLGPGAIGSISRSDRPQAKVFSFVQYQALSRDNNGVLATVAATPTIDHRVYWGERLIPGSDLQRASCALVSGSYFPLFGARAFQGRLLGPDDDGPPGSNPVAVVSHAFWSSRLGGVEDAIGSTIRLQDVPYTIVGIAEPIFRGHAVEVGADIWVPLSMQESVTRSPSRLEPGVPIETYWLNVLMRLKPGFSFAQAESAVNARLQQIFLEQAGEGISEKEREDLERMHIPLTPMGRGLSRLRTTAGRPLTLLWAATGLVLLVACANLGGLLLVRAAARRHEFGIRRALGGSRADLMRPLLAESTVLAATGTLLGCVAAYGLVPVMHRWLVAIRGVDTLDVRIAWPELQFAAGVGVLTVFLFGLAPAAVAARGVFATALRSGGPSATSGMGEVRARGLLVAAQFAVAITLLSSAGLFLRTLTELRAADLGLDAERVVGIRVDPQGAGFAPETQPSMRPRILEKVAALPGIDAAAFTGSLPLQGDHERSTISVSGYVPSEDEDVGVIHVAASPHYFDTLGIRLLEGRTPGYGEPDALVVNQAFAARFFPGKSALGGVIGQRRSIVGVVTNVRQINLRDAPPPLVYRSMAGYEGFVRTLAWCRRSGGPPAGRAGPVSSSARLSLPAEAAAEAVREAVREVEVEEGAARPGLLTSRSMAAAGARW